MREEKLLSGSPLRRRSLEEEKNETFAAAVNHSFLQRDQIGKRQSVVNKEPNPLRQESKGIFRQHHG